MKGLSENRGKTKRFWKEDWWCIGPLFIIILNKKSYIVYLYCKFYIYFVESVPHCLAISKNVISESWLCYHLGWYCFLKTTKSAERGEIWSLRLPEICVIRWIIFVMLMQQLVCFLLVSKFPWGIWQLTIMFSI